MIRTPPPPLHSVDPDDWWVFRDQCIDADAPQHYVDLLWRIAKGLELSPKLSLYADFGQGADSVLVQVAIDPPQGDRQRPYWQNKNPDINICWGVPSDYPGLIEYYPAVAWDFFVKIAV